MRLCLAFERREIKGINSSIVTEYLKNEAKKMMHEENGLKNVENFHTFEKHRHIIQKTHQNIFICDTHSYGTPARR